MGRISGIICAPARYRFGGYTFEVNKISGPWPIFPGGEPFKRVPEKFWDAYELFAALPRDEQEKHCLDAGGCVVRLTP